MSKTFVVSVGLFLRATGTLLGIGVLPAVVFGQSLAGGANLFAPSRQAGKELEAERALPITPFYTTGIAKTEAESGTLIRSEPATDYALPPGVTATRILYHTRTANNVDAIASGVVLVPYGQPPAGGWPLLAWSHGTSGVARNCVPSRMKSLFYNWEGFYEYVLMGYAVVATDYAGLGTKGAPRLPRYAEQRYGCDSFRARSSRGRTQSRQKVACRRTFPGHGELLFCHFAHDSSGFPVLLLFFDAQSGRSCYPLDRHFGPVARTWRRPFPGRGVAS